MLFEFFFLFLLRLTECTRMYIWIWMDMHSELDEVDLSVYDRDIQLDTIYLNFV